jgi:hypothetical protein
MVHRGSLRGRGQDLPERWPLFTHAAGGLGVHSAVAAPLGARLSVVCAYYREPVIGETAALATAGQVAAALTCVTLRSAQDLGPDLIASPGDHGAVHQAIGMISAQADCGIDVAYDLLAARAFADGVPLEQAATAVVRGDTRFEPHS